MSARQVFTLASVPVMRAGDAIRFDLDRMVATISHADGRQDEKVKIVPQVIASEEVAKLVKDEGIDRALANRLIRAERKARWTIVGAVTPRLERG